jgi:hypothetical protein
LAFGGSLPDHGALLVVLPLPVDPAADAVLAGGMVIRSFVLILLDLMTALPLPGWCRVGHHITYRSAVLRLSGCLLTSQLPAGLLLPFIEIRRGFRTSLILSFAPLVAGFGDACHTCRTAVRKHEAARNRYLSVLQCVAVSLPAYTLRLSSRVYLARRPLVQAAVGFGWFPGSLAPPALVLHRYSRCRAGVRLFGTLSLRMRGLPTFTVSFALPVTHDYHAALGALAENPPTYEELLI